MNRPRITPLELADLVSKQSAANRPADPVFAVGLRPYYKDSMGKRGENDIGIYDDAIILVGPDIFMPCNANTDPSRQKPGIATLVPGLHLFKKGKHGISKPGGGYPAFRPASADESLPVTRHGREGIFKGIAINIHHGGYTTTSSEGCQTIYPDQWMEFQVKAYQAMDKAGQKVLPYLLIEQ